MASNLRARDQNELVDIINQALDEVEDLRAAIEYDQEYRGESSLIVEPVSRGLSRLLLAINEEDYALGQGDWLHFLDPLRSGSHRTVPFWPLLKLIIDTHERGYLPSAKE